MPNSDGSSRATVFARFTKCSCSLRQESDFSFACCCHSCPVYPHKLFPNRNLRRSFLRHLTLILLLTLYLVATIFLGGVRQLHLDEILQLQDTRQPSVSKLLTSIPVHHIGSGPLGYLTQQATLKVTGYSVRRARLPAAIFGTGAVFAMYWLAMEMGLRYGAVAAAIFAMLPFTVRYATEARPYSQALFFSILATIFYVRLSRRPGWRLAGAYSAALAAAAYAQPFAASVGLAHVLWSFLSHDRRVFALGTTAFGISIAAFLPWFYWSHLQWTSGLEAGAVHFAISTKTPLMLFRELSGAGYWGSGILLILCLWPAISGRIRLQLTLLATVPIVAGLAVDAWFGYFIAARQFIWVLAPISLLAGCAERYGPWRRMALVLLGVVCLWQGFCWFTRPQEDWQSASAAIQDRTDRRACLVVVPPEHAGFYQYFRPHLQQCGCDGPNVVLAISPYSTSTQQSAQMVELRARGYRKALWTGIRAKGCESRYA